VQARLDDAEQNALKGGKKAMAKMDSRIRWAIISCLLREGIFIVSL
jgi:hypothetical protein